jgi:hypothetical protein
MHQRVETRSVRDEALFARPLGEPPRSSPAENEGDNRRVVVVMCEAVEARRLERNFQNFRSTILRRKSDIASPGFSPLGHASRN